jgi:hypothetical protein
MNALEELMICISTQDRLAFLKFRQRYVSQYDSDKFKRLLKQAQKELQNGSEQSEEEY